MMESWRPAQRAEAATGSRQRCFATRAGSRNAARAQTGIATRAAVACAQAKPAERAPAPEA